MKHYQNKPLPFLLIFGILSGFFAEAGLAATITTTGSGNWNSTTPDAPWPGGTVPVTGSDIIISNGHTVTVTANVVNSPGSFIILTNGQLTVGGFSLTNSGATTVYGTMQHTNAAGKHLFSGDVTIHSGGLWSETAATPMTIGGNLQNNGTFTSGNGIHTFSGTGKTFSGTITINSLTISGTYTNIGTLTAASSLDGTGKLTQGENAIFNVGAATISPDLNADSATNTVNYNRATAQTLKAVAYHHLILSGSGSAPKNITGVTTINGDLTFSSAAFVRSNSTLAISGTLNYNSSGISILSHNITAGSLIMSGNQLYLGTGLTHTFTGNWTRTAGTIYGGSSTLKIGGNIIGSGGTFNANTGTVEWCASGPQAITPFAYNNLTLSGSGIKSMTGVTTVASNLTLTGNASMVGAGNLSISGDFTFASSEASTLTGNVSGGSLIMDGAGTLNLGTRLIHSFSGDWTQTAGTLHGGSSMLKIKGNALGSGGTFTPGAGTVEWNAAGPQTVAAVTYNHLTLSGSGSKVIGAGTTVEGNLSIAPSGAATASVANGLNINVGRLFLGGLIQSNGTWGSTSASSATHQNDGFFNATTGYLTVNLLKTPDFLVQDGDVWVMVGDSITWQNLYTVYLEAFVRARYPQMKLATVNSGCSGETFIGAQIRWKTSITNHNPTLVTVDYGMNDHTKIYPGAQNFLDVPSSPEMQFITGVSNTFTHSRLVMLSASPLLAPPDYATDGGVFQLTGSNSDASSVPLSWRSNPVNKLYAEKLTLLAGRNQIPFIDQMTPLQAIWGPNYFRDTTAALHLAMHRTADTVSTILPYINNQPIFDGMSLPDKTNLKAQSLNSAVVFRQYLIGWLAQFDAFMASANPPFVRVSGYTASSRDADLIHPNEAGHLCMAGILLKAFNADGLVSAVVLDAKTSSIVSATKAVVSNFTVQNGTLSFKRLDASLPFPIDPLARPALDLDVATTAGTPKDLFGLSRYMLTVTNLPEGKYNLAIDGVEVAKVSATQLAQGFDAGLLTNGPVAEQTQRLLTAVRTNSFVICDVSGNVQTNRVVDQPKIFSEAQPVEHVWTLKMIRPSFYLFVN